MLLSGQGRYYGVIDSLDTDPVLLQRDPFLRSAESEFCLGLARAIVTGKLQNMRLILRRYARKREAPALVAAERSLQGFIADIAKTQTLDAIRGYEGSGSKAYFEGLRTLLPAAWEGWTPRLCCRVKGATMARQRKGASWRAAYHRGH